MTQLDRIQQNQKNSGAPEIAINYQPSKQRGLPSSGGSKQSSLEYLIKPVMEVKEPVSRPV